MTPEGKVKKAVTALLKQYEPDLFYWMPVPGGYGQSVLDYEGCYRGQFFAVETKRAGKEPTDRQRALAARMQAAGAKVFVVAGDQGMDELKGWLDAQ